MTRSKAIHVTAIAVLALAGALGSVQVFGDDDRPYTEGSVWAISMIRVKPGMQDVYLRELLPLRKKIDEEAKKQGLIVSSHIFSGPATGRDDFDIMFLDEYRNWAAFDGLEAKYNAIEKKLVGPEDKQVQLMTRRGEVREILGDKFMQELIPK